MHPYSLLLVTTGILLNLLNAGTNMPAFDLSRIVITSARATCVRSPQEKKQYSVTYHDNVVVTFADGTKATSDQLNVIIDPTALAKERIKTVQLSHNVVVTSAAHTAHASIAVFDLVAQRCKLDGDVQIAQKAVDPKDIPVTIACNSASIDLATQQLELTGSTDQPVTTTITLATSPKQALKKRKKKHGKN